MIDNKPYQAITNVYNTPIFIEGLNTVSIEVKNN